MYVAKISGSRYLISLENDQGQWFLRMKLDEIVEGEVGVTHMTKRGLHNNMGTLFSKVNVQVNNFQHDLLHKELVSQVTHLLAANEDKGDEIRETEVKEDPQIVSLLSRISKLEDTIISIESRLERVEQLSGK